jgi:hypothetical protein
VSRARVEHDERGGVYRVYRGGEVVDAATTADELAARWHTVGAWRRVHTQSGYRRPTATVRPAWRPTATPGGAVRWLAPGARVGRMRRPDGSTVVMVMRDGIVTHVREFRTFA